MYVDFKYLEETLLSCTLPGVIDSVEDSIRRGNRRIREQNQINT